MKQPGDTVVQAKDIKFTSARVPLLDALFGFRIDPGVTKANDKIRERLDLLRSQTEPSPDEIIMDGRLVGAKPTLTKCEDALQETPFAPFALNFENALSILNARYERYRQLRDNYQFDGGIDLFTYEDIIIIEMAAICLEKETLENYTIKVYLRRQKHAELCAPIEAVLQRKLCVDCDKKPINVAMAIKILRDKFLCHFDNFEDYDTKGREGLADGKWTPGDRIILTLLLLPPFKDGPIAELLKLINQAVDKSRIIGESEIILGALRNAEMYTLNK